MHPRLPVSFVLSMALAVVVCVSLILPGCGSTSASGEQVSAGNRIVSMSLQTAPNALNWDGEPGPDGVRARLFLFAGGQSDAAQLQRGSVDFLLFEGRVAESQIAGTPPYHLWSFTASEFAASAGQGLIGWCYEPTLAWGKHVPRTNTITLVVRINQPGLPPLYSAPTLLSMGR